MRTATAQADKGILVIVAALGVIGLVNLYSASSASSGPWFMRELAWWPLAIGLGFIAIVVDYRIILRLWWVPYLLSILMLLATDLIGATAGGSQRWLQIGGLRIQPSEFAKIAVIAALAQWLADHVSPRGYRLQDLIVPLILIALPTGLVMIQPDLGTGMVILLVSTAIILFAGVRAGLLLFSGVTALLVSIAAWFWFLKPYQKARITTFLNPEADPAGAGYHSIQSKLAIATGGWLGKGWIRGDHAQANYLPELHTDFAFSVFAEEWGFVGSALVIALFASLIFWGVRVSQQARDRVGALFAFGLTTLLAIHVFVNIFMVLGLAPVVGIPLPFFSYGGSSLLTAMLAFGLIYNVHYRRNMF